MRAPQPEGTGAGARSGVRWRRIGVSVVLVAVAAAIFTAFWVNIHYSLPDADDPANVAETKRAVTAIEQQERRRSASGRPIRCAARLLGRREAAALVHVNCFEGGQMYVSVPARVEAGGAVRFPGDGSLFADDVKDMFGLRLGSWYLNHQGSFTDVTP